MYITTSKLNSSFGTIAKATGIKMAAKAVGKNSSFRFSVKNNLNMRSCSEARLPNFDNLLVLNRFLRFKLNENLLLFNFLWHFFYLVRCIQEFMVFNVISTLNGFLHN